MIEVVTVELGDARYEPVMRQIRTDRALRREMWQDAEHGALVEVPGKRWTVVLAGRRTRTPVAWAAARIDLVDGQRTLICSDNYERRGVGRERGLYQVAYAHRHRTIVAVGGLPAITYLFDQPRTLHERDRWYCTGLQGPGELLGHWWWQLRRDPA